MKFITMGCIFLLMAVLVVSGCSAPDDGQKEVSELARDLGIDVVSTSFDDFGAIFCDPNSSSENISILVDEEYKGNFVQWTGTIYAITDNGRSYTVQVKHCPDSLTDAAVTFNINENEAVSKLIKGQEITYIGRVTRYQKGVGFWVEEAYLVPE
ncbi:OB-fold protein [Methanococcoides sp. LMO-2]|uniref:Nucleic acid binding OB-fold tRNA/helicase-type n=1 Tax=Methanococcoides cohabitans TaxID=3136559 RepID=A0ABU9KS52_9EURY